MRYIHPVTVHEQFIASGVYHYFQNDVQRPVEESWSIHRHPDGEYFIRIDHDAREESGHSLLVEVLQNAEGQLVRFDVNAFHAGVTDGVKSLRATYTVLDDYVHVGRTINVEPREYVEIQRPTGEVVFQVPGALMLGYRIMTLSATDDPDFAIFDPCLMPPRHDNAGTFLVSPLTVNQGDTDAFKLGKQTLQATHYQRPDVDGQYWIDERRTLLKCHWQQDDTLYRIDLTNYAHS